MTPLCTFRRAIDDPRRLGNALSGPSWRAWKVLLLAALGEPLFPDELEHFRELTGRSVAPTSACSEFWCIAGRRAGKSRAIGCLSVYLATMVSWPMLARGERGLVSCIAADKVQASVILGYAIGVLNSSPVLAKLIKRSTSEEIELTNGLTIVVKTASFRRIRGYTAIAVICDELAYWHDDDVSANPADEVLAAARPMLATTGGPLICISSPYARRGPMWSTYQRHFGPDGDPAILVAQASSRTLNSTLPQSVVDRAFEEDPHRAQAEYMGAFRTDVESFVSLEILTACEDPVAERPYENGLSYVAFCDPSGGSADSMTLAIAHVDPGGIAVLDVIREIVPPFDPREVVESFASVLKDYGLRTVHGDRYGGVWVSQTFDMYGVQYLPPIINEKALSKSEIYGALLPMLNSRTCALLQHDKLRRQLLGLERRRGRGGADIIDHGRNGHDDIANAAGGALVLVQHAPPPSSLAAFRRKIEYPVIGVV